MNKNLWGNKVKNLLKENWFKILLPSLLLVFIFLLPLNTEARSGCCSWHGGVCGCGCCDGTPLSATCAPYYPECGGGYSYPSIPSCPSMSSYDSLSGSCKCYPGYVVGTDILGHESCISADQKCHDNYGYNSRYNSLTNICECSADYAMSGGTCIDKDQLCRNQLGLFSSYNSLYDKCECSSGYVISNGKCAYGNTVCQSEFGVYSSYNSFSKKCEIDKSQLCRDQLGLFSSYNSLSDKCECNSGYVISNGQCVYGSTACQSESGVHSSYDIFSKKCECDSGYFFGGSQCVTIEISSVYPTEVKVGDEVTIKGKNFGNNKYGNFDLYVGSSKIYKSDISRWEDEKIIFTVGDYIDSDYVKIKDGYYINVRGSYLEITEAPQETSNFLIASKQVVTPQQIQPQPQPEVSKTSLKSESINDGQIKKEVENSKVDYYKNHQWFRERLIIKIANNLKVDTGKVAFYVYTMLPDIK